MITDEHKNKQKNHCDLITDYVNGLSVEKTPAVPSSS